MNSPTTNATSPRKIARIIRISENDTPFLNDDSLNSEIERLTLAFEQFEAPDELQKSFPKNQPAKTKK